MELRDKKYRSKSRTVAYFRDGEWFFFQLFFFFLPWHNRFWDATSSTSPGDREPGLILVKDCMCEELIVLTEKLFIDHFLQESFPFHEELRITNGGKTDLWDFKNTLRLNKLSNMNRKLKQQMLLGGEEVKIRIWNKHFSEEGSTLRFLPESF